MNFINGGTIVLPKVASGTIETIAFVSNIPGAETDPVFTAWNKSTGISITSSQITDKTNTYNSTGTAVVTGTAVAAAIGTLDVTGASGITANKTINAWSETDGKVSISTQNISIPTSQINDITATAAELNVLDGITATTQELNYIDGVTSNIQTQLNDKEPTIATKNSAFNKNYGTTATDVKMNGTQAVGVVDAVARIDHVHPVDTSRQAVITGAASTITSSNLTTSRVLISDTSGKVAVSAITPTQLGYLTDVTSNIQAQLDSKAASSHTHTIGYYSTAAASDLNTTLGTGQFSWYSGSTNIPVAGSFGQGINIVSSGTAHNNSNNWITQLAFSTTNNTAYFRGKTNADT